MTESKPKRTRGTTKRLEDTGYYTHPWVQKLTKDGIHLYKYLFSNTHCNQAGLYRISLLTISFETKIDLDRLPELLKGMEKNVKWWSEFDLMWVKEFLYENKSSDTFLKAAASCLGEIKQKDIVKEFIEYNLSEHDIRLSVNLNNNLPESAVIITKVTEHDTLKADFKIAKMIKYYEEAIGKTLTPNDLEKLKDFAEHYPDGSFERAVDEAVRNKAGSPVSYISRILEHWQQKEGPTAEGDWK